MMGILDTLLMYLADSGWGHLQWGNVAMLGIGLLFIWLAVAHRFEPLLLVPIGFGMLIGNIPYDASRLALGAYDGPAAVEDLHYYRIELGQVRLHGAEQPLTLAQARDHLGIEGEIDSEAELHALIRASQSIALTAIEELPAHQGPPAVAQGQALMTNAHSLLAAQGVAPAIVYHGQGRHVLQRDAAASRHSEVWSSARQDPYNASIFWWLYAGVGLAGFYPPLIFLGIGALTDFGPMLSNPRTLLLGAAAQFGIFASLFGAVALGFSLEQAASIGIIGGADGPTAIFTCSQLAPELLGAVALAAYSYMAMVPLIQPPIIRLLTTAQERQLRMPIKPPVSTWVRIAFPILGFLLTAMIAPGGLPLLGMLFLGNLLRESLVTDRLAQTAQSSFIDIVTILLGVTVGAKTSAATFLDLDTLRIFLLGMMAFAMATAAGVLCARLMNLLSREKINPMIGAAGVSAVPMAARVVHRLGQEEDPQNHLLMHAMGPNVAGVIGSAVAAGVLLSGLAGP